ncbi:MAG: VCBS repeat-containing protein, partial [Thermoanaerobaculia bacterium]
MAVGNRVWSPAVGALLALLAGAADRATPADLFADRTAAVGLDFIHFNGMTGRFYMPENMGAGGALFDFDNDGDLDLYLIQGSLMGPDVSLEDAVEPPHHPLPLTDRLYRNDLSLDAEGRVVVRFADVTDSAALPPAGHGMGAATGDYDNDGWIDLYLTRFGSNLLLRNRGDGTFEDITDSAGVDDPRWSVPAVFFDFDRDGWLDLFVGNYLDFSWAKKVPCTTRAGAADYCDPWAYDTVGDRLFRNRGDGTFEDVTRTAGLDTVAGRGLGAVAFDADGDGWLDLYVANDRTPNQLWRNRGDGTFFDDVLAGAAVNGEGLAEASMGVDAGDADGDGDLDLVMGHFTGETHTLFVNVGDGLFEDRTVRSGLAAPTLAANGFGTGWLDIDNDGRLDLLVVNGAVRALDRLVQQGDRYPYHQPNQLFRGRGDGSFEEVTSIAGSVFGESAVSRGALFGDLDNDGDTDVVVTNNSGPARVL